MSGWLAGKELIIRLTQSTWAGAVVYMDCSRQWKNSGPSTFIYAIVCSFRLLVKKNEKLTFLSNSNNLDINTINNKWNFQKIDFFAVPV